MSALGELIVFGIYVILIIPILLTLIVCIKRKKKLSGTLFIIISLIPLALFSYSQYQNHRDAELDYVGIYDLTEYPNCDSCILKLNDDNTYLVSIEGSKIEHGKWNFRSGGDYWIVDIGEHGTLGSGRFKYTTYKNRSSKE
ncbi:hypothetical protein [uncultured Psychroserpens sp.]|uniref:hypothetical protein n=1 Tax=uncultured Psychroserpens sp. TaxID=255436 RepID=UPI00260C0ED6|nr:hypothetical protein [uncultured Psychroserpens sp.]